jgi:Fe-S-cluster containining protein
MPSSHLKPSDLFRCTLCGDCCRGYGGTYVSPEDIAAIAEFLATDPAVFVDRFCRISGGRYLLAQGADGYCIFWDTVCRIHPVKPRMCRRWPFIESVVTDVSNWRIMASSCPGMRRDIDLDRVCACVRQILSAEAEEPDPGDAAPAVGQPGAVPP